MTRYDAPSPCGVTVPPSPVSAVRNGRYYRATWEPLDDGSYRGHLLVKVGPVPTAVSFDVRAENEAGRQQAFEHALDQLLQAHPEALPGEA